MPHGQEKSGKSNKNDKSQEKSGKNGDFWKKSGNLTKFDKTSDFVCSNF